MTGTQHDVSKLIGKINDQRMRLLRMGADEQAMTLQLLAFEIQQLKSMLLAEPSMADSYHLSLFETYHSWLQDQESALLRARLQGGH